MSRLGFKQMKSVILDDSSSKKFIWATIIGLAFSLAVIICTIGLMDGFERTLKNSLKQSSGDFLVTSRNGYFQFLPEQISLLKKNLHVHMSAVIKSEGFLSGRDGSHGVVVMGVNSQFGKVTDLELGELRENEVVIGHALAQKLDLSLGDNIQLALISGKDKLPHLINFVVKKVINHGVYDKDLRFLYIDEKKLRDHFNLRPFGYNLIVIKDLNSQGLIRAKMRVKQAFAAEKGDFVVKEFWEEFVSLISSVKSEKMSIVSILQIIVIVSIFNVAAFIFYIWEKKGKTLFLLRALGFKFAGIRKFWRTIVLEMWIKSCFISLVFVYIFNLVLTKTDIFLLPGDVYVLSRFSLKPDVWQVSFIFILSLIWMLLLSHFSLRKLKQKTLISGLREDYT